LIVIKVGENSDKVLQCIKSSWDNSIEKQSFKFQIKKSLTYNLSNFSKSEISNLINLFSTDYKL